MLAADALPAALDSANASGRPHREASHQKRRAARKVSDGAVFFVTDH